MDIKRKVGYNQQFPATQQHTKMIKISARLGDLSPNKNAPFRVRGAP